MFRKLYIHNREYRDYIRDQVPIDTMNTEITYYGVQTVKQQIKREATWIWNFNKLDRPHADWLKIREMWNGFMKIQKQITSIHGEKITDL